MENCTFQDIERSGLTVSSVVNLINFDDIDSTKLTALVNAHDTGFNDSFTSVSSKKVKLTELLNNYDSEIKLSDV